MMLGGAGTGAREQEGTTPLVQLTDVRVRLDGMTERIVGRLRERSRFPLNEAVYVAGAVPIRGRAGLSLLEFALEGLEAYHASLGRYVYADQHPVLGAGLPEPRVARAVPGSSLAPVPISTREALLPFYRRLLPDLCRPGSDPASFGETAYVDADLLALLNERVQVGRSVAQAKLGTDPSILAVAHDRAALDARLRHREREEAVVASARATAARHDLAPDLAERVFRWIIDETTRVEVVYLQHLTAARGA
jgi:chorismate mutase